MRTLVTILVAAAVLSPLTANATEIGPGPVYGHWYASEVSSGLYFYKLTAGELTEARRMMLVK